jgi:hypothetical protein
MFKKQLEKQNLLGGAQKDASKASAGEDATKGEGYKDEQREKLDKLFSEPPVVNE